MGWLCWRRSYITAAMQRNASSIAALAQIPSGGAPHGYTYDAQYEARDSAEIMAEYRSESRLSRVRRTLRGLQEAEALDVDVQLCWRMALACAACVIVLHIALSAALLGRGQTSPTLSLWWGMLSPLLWAALACGGVALACCARRCWHNNRLTAYAVVTEPVDAGAMAAIGQVHAMEASDEQMLAAL